MNEETKKLVPFLRELANRLEREELQPEQVHRIGKFFMSYHFEDELESDHPLSEDFSQDDLVKFCSLGWYIYNFLLKDKITE